jgi:lambda repressor-like predicted transcriptional regulator
MRTSNFDLLSDKGTELSIQIGAQFLSAYTECSEPIKQVVNDMLEIIRDEETDDDDRQMALSTLYEALFPHRHQGRLGIAIEQLESDAADDPNLREFVDQMDREEATFADNLARIMRERGLTQQQLADTLGVGQSAISNMLGRTCRPQKRTVERLANALKVDPKQLWPTP